MRTKTSRKGAPSLFTIVGVAVIILISVGAFASPGLYSNAIHLHRTTSSSSRAISTTWTTQTVYTTVPVTTTSTALTTDTLYSTSTVTVPVTSTTVATDTSNTTVTQTIPVTTTETDSTTISTTTTLTATSPSPYASYGCTDSAYEQNGITCSWLEQQASVWKPSSNTSLGWTVQFTKASYDNLENTTMQVESADLNMLLQSGATCIRMDIGYDAWLLDNVTAQNEITSLVNSIHAQGKCLIIADAAAEYYWTNPIPWSQFQTAWINRVQTIASLYHPNFYIVVKEPYWYMPMVSDAATNPQFKNVTSWLLLTRNLTNTVLAASPFTKVGVSISFGYVSSAYYVSYLSGLPANVDFVGFDIYTASDYASTVSYINQSGLTKNIWISEAWSSPLVNDSFSSDRASLDQLWIQDLYYFGLYIHSTNINPFFTDCMASYTFGDTSYSSRTPVFYEYQHLATDYDGYAQ